MSNKPKLLVVDDEESNRYLMKEMLSANGYDVSTAENGKQGIALAKIEKPALILMDMMMPVMDGYSTLSNIKSDPSIKNIPVIMVTSVGFELNKKLAGGMGASGYVTKPVDFARLLTEIKRCLSTK